MLMCGGYLLHATSGWEKQLLLLQGRPTFNIAPPPSSVSINPRTLKLSPDQLALLAMADNSAEMDHAEVHYFNR